MTIFT